MPGKVAMADVVKNEDKGDADCSHKSAENSSPVTGPLPPMSAVLPTPVPGTTRPPAGPQPTVIPLPDPEPPTVPPVGPPGPPGPKPPDCPSPDSKTDLLPPPDPLTPVNPVRPVQPGIRPIVPIEQNLRQGDYVTYQVNTAKLGSKDAFFEDVYMDTTHLKMRHGPVPHFPDSNPAFNYSTLWRLHDPVGRRKQVENFITPGAPLQLRGDPEARELSFTVESGDIARISTEVGANGSDLSLIAHTNVNGIEEEFFIVPISSLPNAPTRNFTSSGSLLENELVAVRTSRLERKETRVWKQQPLCNERILCTKPILEEECGGKDDK